MPPHPNMMLEVRTMQNQDLLAQATRVRLINEATKGMPAPSPIDGFRAAVRQVFAWFGTVSVTTPRLRPQESG